MPKMLIFGLGYCASRLAESLKAESWTVMGTRREGGPEAISFYDEETVCAAIDSATHILSTVPPARDGSEPVLERCGEHIASAELEWIGYLSSTGVYGDTDGAWVDETAPVGTGRRKARSDADLQWQNLREDMRVFRLPGIYGPGRNPLKRVLEGKAKRVDVPDQVFSRVHVDDIVSAIKSSFHRRAEVFNIADDLPAAQHEVVAHAARLLGVELPELLSLEQANLSASAMAFYDENRRVANGKAKRLLNWNPRYQNYKAGLEALASSED